MKHSLFRVRSDELNANLYIYLIASDISTLYWVAMSDKRKYLLFC
jgi:hypothetical protein